MGEKFPQPQQVSLQGFVRVGRLTQPVSLQGFMQGFVFHGDLLTNVSKYNSSTCLRAQGVRRRNFRLDLMLGLL